MKTTLSQNVKRKDTDKIIALAGNPNVGKSTVFNQLTGLNQHTGNWPGKTVVNAQGYCTYNGKSYTIVDIPGCYSLMAHSADEEVARDFICFENPDAVVVVCDATCLERNLNLVLQILEVTSQVIICVNLMDEAKKKQIEIDLHKMSDKLGVPVIGTCARSNKGLYKIFESLDNLSDYEKEIPVSTRYPDYIEEAILHLAPLVREIFEEQINTRWMCARLLDANENLTQSINRHFHDCLKHNSQIQEAISHTLKSLEEKGISSKQISDEIACAFIKRAEEICHDSVTFKNKTYNSKDRKLDKLLTSKYTGFPIMFMGLLFIFWLTIIGANYPSDLLSNIFSRMENYLIDFFIAVKAPSLMYEILVFGIYRVVAWVVSVMLPPMAIFFPLFTLMEDFGYLPRVAFNLDRCFKKCCACGKQALTMCMGFGCNAAGVIGCRIIDSPRERLIAIITNNFVPCNGRFPIMIAVISMFFMGSTSGILSSFLSAVILAGIIVLGIIMSLAASKLLSMTVLKGVPSSFTLELPPYRRPQVGKVIIRSIFDRTLFVLGRAVVAAAPAGLLIWIMANVTMGNATLLARCSGFFDPFARLLGMDGVILVAFILGLPANEIIVPIIIMAYMAQGNLLKIEDLGVVKQLLTDNGWTWITAVSTVLFSLMHWPCSTTCLTIKKETQSLKWTVISIIIPTITGMAVCFVFASVANFFAG